MKSLLINLGMALGVLTFVMFSTHFFRAFDLLARGGSPFLLGKVLVYLLPDILRFALPLSMLVASVLVFSRMSADNEITALKSSGVSLWQIISFGLVLSGILSALCIWISFFVSPQCRYRSEEIRWSIMSSGPLSMIEPGVVSDLSENTKIFIREKDGDLLRDVHLVIYNNNGGVIKDVTAEYGMVIQVPKQRKLEIILKKFTVTKWNFETTGVAQCSSFVVSDTLTVPVEYGEMQDSERLSRKLKMMNLKMLFADMIMVHDKHQPITKHLVQLQSRLVLAMSPFAFFLLGIPFGIRNRRSETSVGLLICVILGLFFYGFLLLGNSLIGKPQFHPEWLLWIPNILYQVGGLFAIWRIGKH
ncbi:MAG: LptF/LptG family permease [Lentisphaeria bacterium]